MRSRNDPQAGAAPATGRLARHRRPAGDAARSIRPSLLAWLPAMPAAVLFIGFFVAPILSIVWESVSGTQLDFSHYAALLDEEIYVSILLQTFKISFLVTLGSLVIGYPVAYFLTTLSLRVLGVVVAIALIPLFTAFLIRTYAWMVILGRQGIINNFLIYTGIVDEPITLLGTTTAVVIGLVHVFTPIAIFTMYAIMAQIDRSVSQAAQTLGATPLQAFFRIYFPLSLPGVFAAGVLIFVMALGFFITPALLGGPADTMISQLIMVQMTTLLNFELGYASALYLLITTLGVLLIASFFIPLEMMWAAHDAQRPRTDSRARRTAIAATVTSAAVAVARPVLGMIERGCFLLIGPLLTRRCVWLWAFMTAVMIFLVAPLIVIVILSFSSSTFIVFPPPGFSLRWWEKLYHASDWHAAFVASIRVGVGATLIAMIVGTASAFWLIRSAVAGKRALFLFSLSPIALPVIILSVALYTYEARLGLLGSYAGLVLGHAVLTTPYVIVVMTSALRGFDRTLEHAALVHGANPIQVLRRITLPILQPALFTAALLAFLVSFDELLVTIFLIGRMDQTLPIKFWGDIKYQIDPLLSAASTLIVLTVTATILIGQWMRTRQAWKLASTHRNAGETP